ncbi:hypothetical protein SO802_008716 [Lithocarpus litseifolius]|uniref:F-box domain-containing protein n=1 Tax=Lithocarpus litseifolius TaxID=425828 RepID=A0AAW2DAF8_9ROSI
MSDYPPEEVVRKILYKLPVKSLIRFRCVSKSWNTLITTPAFINCHLTRSHSLLSNSNKLIVRHCLEKPYVEHYKLIDDSNDSFDQIQNIELPLTSRPIQHFRLIGSANGLFSLYEQKCFILWNPSIRKFITLPKPCITVKTHGKVTCHSAFGFDLRTNDYKVVRIAFPSEEAKLPLIEAYSLNEGSWKLTSASFPSGIGVSCWHKPVASLGGAVHFAVYDKDNRCRPLVLSFDLGDEVCHLMSLPNCAFSWSNLQTSVIGGSLALLFYDDRFVAKKCCDIWVMKEYGIVDSWTKLFTVDLNKRIIRVLHLPKNGNILVEVNLPSDRELSSYDPKSQHVKSLGICGRRHYFHVDNYVANLVLLDKPNDAVSKRGACRKRKCRYKLDSTQNLRICFSQFYLFLGINVIDWCRPAASLNGAVHFAAEYKHKPGGPCGPLVLSFDLHDEVFHVVPLPNVIFKWTDNVHTSVIGGSLSLLFYYELGLNSVILEGDCEILMKSLMEDSLSLASSGLLIQDVKAIAESFQCIRFSHVRREGNKVAHNLARHARHVTGFSVWMEDVPSHTLLAYKADLPTS